MISSQTGKIRMKMTKGMQLAVVRRWEREKALGRYVTSALGWEDGTCSLPLSTLLPGGAQSMTGSQRPDNPDTLRQLQPRAAEEPGHRRRTRIQPRASTSGCVTL